MWAPFIVLPALILLFIACLAAWRHARNPSNYNPRAELVRLRNHAAWIEQRLDTARRERWGHDMIAGLSDQLGDACRQLSRAQRNARRRRIASMR